MELETVKFVKITSEKLKELQSEEAKEKGTEQDDNSKSES